MALRGDIGRVDGHALWLLALSSAPPALAGYLLERPVERALSTPTAVAAGLVAGSVAMILGDRAPQRRRISDTGAADALWLGLAQTAALVPGVSRSGASLGVARWRCFTRVEAHRLSRHVGLPVIGGATGLKAVRLTRRGVDRAAQLRLAAGSGAAFLSTLGAARLIAWIERDRPLWPYAAYRVVLAGAILWRRWN